MNDGRTNLDGTLAVYQDERRLYFGGRSVLYVGPSWRAEQGRTRTLKRQGHGYPGYSDVADMETGEMLRVRNDRLMVPTR